ncbi:MAG: ABC transporter permease [Actinobacteria bacterium]|nr:ABC transporter permease [Actinomycetota bacterium]
MLSSVFPVGSRARSIAAAGLSLAIALVAVQFVLPGSAGGGRGTPMAILFNGVVLGCGTALIALGLVLVYRSLRIINFAQGALGAAGGRLFFEFVQFTQVPFPIALLLGVGMGAVVGVGFDLIFGRRFFNHPRIVLTVVTVAALPFVAFFLAGLMPSLPIFPRSGLRSLVEQEGLVPSRGFLPFSGWKFQIGGFNNAYGFPEVFAIELFVFALIGVVCFLRYTRSGVAIRALAENSERASLLGIPVGNLSTMVWGIAGALSALGVIGVGSLTAPAAATASGVFIPALLAPLTAAVIARFESISVAVFSSLVLVTTATAVLYSYPTQAGLIQVGYFLLLVAFLVLQKRRAGRSEEGAGQGWAAVREQRSVPKELAGVSTVRNTRWALIAFGLLALIVFPIVVPTRFQFLGSTILIQAIIGVSLVVLTGWAGQISLGQFGFSAVGAIVGGALTAKAGVPFWFAVPIASAFAGAFAAVIGIPALRLRGLFLAVTTLAFAIAAEQTFFNKAYFGWLLPETIDRPTLFFLNFDQDRPMYYLSLFCLVLAILVTVNLRRSRFGRLLIAMRENEANVQSFGVSAVRLKLTAFAVSGALAGFSGAVFVHQQRGLSALSFGSQRSVDVFVFTVLGGIGSVGGALLGSGYDNLLRYFLPSNDFFRTVLGALQFGGSTLLVLYVAPAGLIGVVTKIRDAWLRIIAQRRQIIVPSLFADYDPAALERRLIPLADPDAHSGLAALGPGARFRLGSELHGGARSAPALHHRDDERLAIGAASASLGDIDAGPPDAVVGAALSAGREDI